MQDKTYLQVDPLAYDNDRIPPELRVLTIVDWLVGRTEQALSRLKEYGLPAVAVYDWIMECTQITHAYLANPANRDWNKPQRDWNIIAVIPARSGSKGVPQKSLLSLGGKTMLQRAIEACKGIDHIKRVLVNTDGPEIAKHAQAYGAEVPFLRPKQLAHDQASLNEVVMFSRYWLHLVERQCFDVLVVASAVTPLLDPQEMNRAMQTLARGNSPSLQSTVALPSCSIDYRRMDTDGSLKPFSALPLRESATYAAQFGAFSMQCFRPYYQAQPWFRPHIYEVEAPPPRPLAHLLPARQGLEIDNPWDIDACGMLMQEDPPVRPCRDGELTVFPETISISASRRWPQCLVYLPPRRECLSLNGTPSAQRVIDAAHAAGIRQVVLWGNAGEWGRDGSLLGCRLCGLNIEELPEDARHAGGMARPEMAPVLRERMALGDVTLLLLDGRAGMLRESSVRAALEKMEECPGETIVSISPPSVHPYYLKHLLEDGTLVSAIEGDASMRQNLPDVYCRDGVLCCIPSKSLRKQRGILITQAEGWVLRDAFDGARSMALSDIQTITVHKNDQTD